MISRRTAGPLLLSLLFCGAAISGALAEGFKVVAVDVQGTRRVGASAVLQTMKTRVGSEFDLQTIREDVKAVWRMGQFSDVRFDAAEAEGGYRLTLIVAEKPIIANVDIDGNKEVDTSDLKKAISVKERELFLEEKVRESARKMQDVYRNKGFYDASVETSVNEESDGAIKVVFRVREGEKLKIARIEITGNRFLSENEVRAAMDTKARGFWSFITDSGTYKQDEFRNDILKIETLYANKGFIDSKVGEPVVGRGPDGLVLSIHIFEGKQYRIGEIRFSGDSAVPYDELRGKVRLKRGEVFSRELLLQDLLELSTILKDKGYAEANVRPVVDKRKEYPLADVGFVVEQGRKFRFGRVEIVGNTKTFDRVIRRQLEVADGKTYHETGLKESRENLLRTSYFKDVKLTTAPSETAKDEKDVKIEVQEGPTGTLSGGLGFSSIDKLFGVVQVTENNLFGRGWKSTLNSQFGARKTVFNLDLRDPNLFDTDYSGLLNLYNTSTRYSDFNKKSLGGRIGLGYNFTKFTNAGLNYRFDSSKVTDPAVAQSPVLQAEFGKGTRKTSSVGLYLSRNSTDRWMDPSKGSILSGSLEYAGGPFGGDSDFMKYSLGGKVFFPVTEKTVLSGNVHWGHAVTTRGGIVMITERYFLGGPYSIRGFKSRSISPVDPNTGEAIGGNKELVMNAEYVFPLMNDIGFKGVLFFDAGNTWGQASWPAKDFGLRYGAGFGFRWYSPMGPLRFEWGWNLDPMPGEAKRVAEFTIGTAF